MSRSLSRIPRILDAWSRMAPAEAPEAAGLHPGEWDLLLSAACKEGVAGLVLRALVGDRAAVSAPSTVLLGLRRAALEQSAAHAWEEPVLAEVTEPAGVSTPEVNE